MTTAPQGTGNSNDIQGARGTGRPEFSPTASRSMLPESLCFHFSGSAPVTVSQDADRLISKTESAKPITTASLRLNGLAHMARLSTTQPLDLPPIPGTPSPRTSNDTTWDNHTRLVL
ncbi:hypothetical protein E4U40_006550 [Claviceps sp. LM458 group G5]|nr:hypothetical protein E4U40_006550 [Claviceps sp. LM458 group G5]KAG6049251.1 hypothetical protein E4U39_006346 [Claviceps sp. Clav50 group G5]